MFRGLLSYVDSVAKLQQGGLRKHLGSGLDSSTGTMEENAHRSRLTFSKYLLQADCVPGTTLNPRNRDKLVNEVLDLTEFIIYLLDCFMDMGIKPPSIL